MLQRPIAAPVTLGKNPGADVEVERLSGANPIKLFKAAI